MSEINDLTQKACDNRATTSQRLTAVQALALARPETAIPALVAVSSDTSAPSEVAAEAGRALGIQLVSAGRENDHDLFRDLTGEAYLACDAAITDAMSHGSAAVAGA